MNYGALLWVAMRLKQDPERLFATPVNRDLAKGAAVPFPAVFVGNVVRSIGCAVPHLSSHRNQVIFRPHMNFCPFHLTLAYRRHNFDGRR